jgi:tetratricopeptide (TPR) repeat protein
MENTPESDRARAEQLNLQAGQRYVKINAHIKVYRSRNAETEQFARNGIEFIEAALKLFPNDPNYLNTYALLLADGLGQRELALEVFERATQLDPENIQIRQNIRDLTAAGPAPRALSAGAVVAIFAALAVIAIIVIALASGR